MSILEELWYGNLSPSYWRIPPSDHQTALNQLIQRQEQALAPLLSTQAGKIYEKLQCNQAELNELVRRDSFLMGFRTGMRMTIEVMEGNAPPWETAP